MTAGFRELAPPPELRARVDRFWLRSASGIATPPILVLPDGCMDLIYRCTIAPDGMVGDGTLLLSGPDRRPRHVAAGPGTAFVGARFHPAEARAVLGVDAADLVDAGTVAAAVSARLAAVERRLAGARNWPELERRLGREVAWLVAAGGRQRPPWRVRAAVRLLGEPADGRAEVARVATAVGVTPRTLQRELVAWTGLAPKLLGRILRFQAALCEIRAGGATLATVAAAAGYADQAHMAREFRTLAGAAPSGLG